MKRKNVPAVDQMAPSSSVPDQDSARTAPPPSPPISKRRKKKSTFTLRAKTLFLTYPCCPLEKEEALSQLRDKVPEVEEYIVAQEEHQSGDLHLHVYLKMKGRTSVTAPEYLDLMGPENKRYHGNYRSCRSPKSVQRYCTKENNYISNMDLTEEKTEVWKPARALAREGKIQEAMKLLETKVCGTSQTQTMFTIVPCGTHGDKQCSMCKHGLTIFLFTLLIKLLEQ